MEENTIVISGIKENQSFTTSSMAEQHLKLGLSISTLIPQFHSQLTDNSTTTLQNKERSISNNHTTNFSKDFFHKFFSLEHFNIYKFIQNIVEKFLPSAFEFKEPPTIELKQFFYFMDFQLRLLETDPDYQKVLDFQKGNMKLGQAVSLVKVLNKEILGLPKSKKIFLARYLNSKMQTLSFFKDRFQFLLSLLNHSNVFNAINKLLISDFLPNINAKKIFLYYCNYFRLYLLLFQMYQHFPI